MGMTSALKRTNHNTGLTGLIAVLCMIVDHVGVIFFPHLTVLRVIGRIALPLFAWGIAVGARHTRDIARYAGRLFLLMIISQPFYMIALNHPMVNYDLNTLQLNIFAVLFLGLLAIWGLQEKKGWMTAASLLLANFIRMDYGIRGVLCILLFYLTQDDPLALALCFAAYCVAWGETSMAVLTIRDTVTIRLQMMALLALPIILWPATKRTRLPRGLMYAMYPAHLAALYAIKQLI